MGVVPANGDLGHETVNEMLMMKHEVSKRTGQSVLWQVSFVPLYLSPLHVAPVGSEVSPRFAQREMVRQASQWVRYPAQMLWGSEHGESMLWYE